MTTYLTTAGAYDLTAIMRAAWAKHRADYAYAAAYRFKLPTFSESLIAVWKRAKFDRAAFERKAAAAAMDQEVRAAKIRQLEGQLERLNYLPAHMSYSTAAEPIKRELAALRG